MRGLLACGAYVPYARLDRTSVAEALGVPAGSGTRAVASYDEDTTSMGVEAARAALRGARATPEVLYFATSDPAYLDKTNATAIHAALDLPPSTMAVDMGGAVRSAAGVLRAALDARGPALAVLSDLRTGLPGGADEREGGDAAVALLLVYESHALVVGESAHPDLVRDVHAIAERDPAVRRARPPLTMQLAPERVLVNMDIDFRPELSTAELLGAIDRIEATVRERHPSVERIFLEVEAIRASWGGEERASADQERRPAARRRS